MLRLARCTFPRRRRGVRRSTDGASSGSLDAVLAFVRDHFDVEATDRRIVDIEAGLARPDAWDDPKQAAALSQELAACQNRVQRVRRLLNDVRDARDMIELAREEGDADVLAEAEAELAALEARACLVRRDVLLSGADADAACFLEVQPGAGGDDSADWAGMLFRMYTRWAAAQGLSVEVAASQPAEVAGLRSGTLRVEGPAAHGLCRAETGVHRLVRISPFDSGGRRHTSFARVVVFPVPTGDARADAPPASELRIDTFRCSGAGGQHVNTTDSGVRITHLPTNTVAICQNGRSQLANRQTAMDMLVAKLSARAASQQRAEREEIAAEAGENSWGSQIRSYVLHPYQMVKDHRTGVTSSDVEGVLSGEALDPFVDAGVEWAFLQRRELE